MANTDLDKVVQSQKTLTFGGESQQLGSKIESLNNVNGGIGKNVLEGVDSIGKKYFINVEAQKLMDDLQYLDTNNLKKWVSPPDALKVPGLGLDTLRQK